MSLVFSNTTTKNGLIQLCEEYCGFNDGDISGNTTRLAKFTGRLNNALSKAVSTIFEVGGTWQFDDSNQTDYPIITTNIVSGQRDYSFTADGSGNLILDVYKVLVANQAGLYEEIWPVDQQSYAPRNYLSGQNLGGIPITYDKTANGIFLDPIPNYNYTAGLKVLINREPSYFTTSDTTKKPGFAGLFHEYLAMHASYYYCLANQITNVKKDLKLEMLQMEEDLKNYYKLREQDNPKVLKPRRNMAN